jgi:hypothetical protein
MCVAEPSIGTDRFFYDRNGQFAIPEGYSLVVTDIIAQAGLCTQSGEGSPNDLYLVLVEGPAATRSFTMRLRGDAIQHYALAGGLVYTSGHEPHVRNTFLSARAIQIQLLGYFVKGDGLDPGEGRF